MSESGREYALFRESVRKYPKNAECETRSVLFQKKCSKQHTRIVGQRSVYFCSGGEANRYQLLFSGMRNFRKILLINSDKKYQAGDVLLYEEYLLPFLKGRCRS